MTKERFYLFRPTDKDIRIEYPELAQVSAFNALANTNELKFVWYYANRTSPLFDESKGVYEKTKKCMKKAFPDDFLLENDKARYLEGNFPPKIKEAIAVMNAYNPSARMRARITIENIFDNLEASIEISEEMQTEMDADLDLKKKYIDLSIKVSESLPTVIAQLEEGYGIRTSSFFGGGDKKMSVMDILHTTDNGKA